MAAPLPCSNVSTFSCRLDKLPPLLFVLLEPVIIAHARCIPLRRGGLLGWFCCGVGSGLSELHVEVPVAEDVRGHFVGSIYCEKGDIVV